MPARLLTALALTLTLAPGLARPEPTGELPAPPAPPPSEAPFPRLGLRIDAGAPDGAVVAVVFRPTPAFRVSAGPAWNYLGYGYQVGGAFSPFRWAVSPVLSLDYGHFFDTDATFLVDKSQGVPPELRPLLERVGYDYLDAQLGLELGSQRGLTFFLRGGLAYVWTTVHGAATALHGSGTSGTAEVTMTDPHLRATIPTVKLGFLYFF